MKDSLCLLEVGLWEWRVLRIWWRGFRYPQWPYLGRRYCLSFGAGPIGVMWMRTLKETRKEMDRAVVEKLVSSPLEERVK